ncbi:hypothetical protein T09_6893 [Trichinella sp. T9]|nr:hypothetical protein T09_6893 [Trichinella sp. T9]
MEIVTKIPCVLIQLVMVWLCGDVSLPGGMNARVSVSQAVPIEAEDFPQWVYLDRRHCLRR